MNVKTILIPFFMVAFSMFTQIGFSQIYYVNHAATGINSGSDWANAYTDLQSALTIATAGTEVWVAQGTYFPTTCSPCTSTQRNISFQIPDGVKVFGGFNGTETNQVDRNWVTNPTVLSGDINEDGGPSSNSYSVVYTLRVSVQTIVDGFTIREGCADLATGSGRSREGGGWYNDGSAGFSSNPMVRNVRFVFNKSNRGAGMFNAGAFNGDASPIYQNVEFISNTAASDGGACFNEATFDGESSPQYYSCKFLDNTTSGAGGGIFNSGTGIKDVDGNILFSATCNPFIVNCIFKNNTCFTESGIGGAIYNLGSKGGNCTPSIFNTLFVENKAFAAAAIYNNGADEGSSSPSITNCTFANNEADPFDIGGGTGGAVYNNASLNGSSAPTVLNCIFWGNSAEQGSQVFRNVDGTPFIAYSLVDKPDCISTNSASYNGTTTCGLGMIYNQNPNFVDPANCDYRLQANSIAINAGDNQVNGIPIDLDSLPRIINATIDLGPYEVEAFSLPINLLSFQAEFDGDSEVDLYWSTVNERESGVFEIERSRNGQEFELITRKDASDLLNVPVTYKTVDKNPLKGNSYYRLKIIEDSGRSYYSDIVEISNFNSTVSTYPNPVIDRLHFNINEANISGEIAYYVYAVSGKEMLRGTIPAENDFSLEVDRLNSGMHSIVLFLNGNKVLQRQFVVTKF